MVKPLDCDTASDGDDDASLWLRELIEYNREVSCLQVKGRVRQCAACHGCQCSEAKPLVLPSSPQDHRKQHSMR